MFDVQLYGLFGPSLGSMFSQFAVLGFGDTEVEGLGRLELSKSCIPN